MKRSNISPHILWGSGLGVVIIACVIVVMMVGSKIAMLATNSRT